jgi:arginine/lysine/ornithine decarboxylase
VDAAHGAHLPLPDCDLACVSTHKTLPALTQTALLHVMSERVDTASLERQMRVFQTSSPSYVLMASVERCVALLETSREALFAAWERHLDGFCAHARRWRRLRLFEGGHDRSKLLLGCADARSAANFLRERGIEPEYAYRGSLLLMTSPCDTEEMMLRLTQALDALDEVCPPAPAAPRPPSTAPCVPSPANCFALPHESIPAKEAAGRVCAEYIWECPPGVPLWLPGQRIDREIEGREWVDVLL